MKTCKVLLTALLMTASVVVFADSPVQGTAPTTYVCSKAPEHSGDTQWCGCYYHYMMEQCKDLGGDDLCSDQFIRDMVEQFGGPSAICEMSSTPDMSAGMCKSTLTYYTTNCPVRAP